MAGPFLTEISKAWDLEAFEKLAKSHPLGPGGRPDEIVGAALYLASDVSSFTTGSIIRIDGGMAIVGARPGGLDGRPRGASLAVYHLRR